MQFKCKYSLFILTTLMLIFLTGASIKAEAAKNSDTGSTTPESATTSKNLVAMVNGSAITRKQFDNAMDYQVEMAVMQGVTLSSAQLSDLKYQMLESLINEELLYQESQKSGIKVEEKEIDDAWGERRQKAQFKTDAEFEEALKKTNKTVASYRAEIKYGLAVDRFIKEKFADNTIIPDTEAKQYYEGNISYFKVPARFRVSHIMIRVAADADQSEKDAATQKLEQAKKRLVAGEDFAAVAKEVSEDSNSKNKGGDLGYISMGPFEKSFEDAVSALKKEETSDIVKTSAGYHILKLTDKTDARTISFEEAKSDIVSNLKGVKVNNMVDSYVKELKNRSTLVTYPIIK